MMPSMVIIRKSLLPKVMATIIAPTPIPMLPMMSSGLRPSFSTVKTAMSVNEMLTIPMMTVCTIGLSIPMSPKIRGA